MDIYFKPVAPVPEPPKPVENTDEERELERIASGLAYFVVGILTGLILAVALGFRKMKKKKTS